MKTIPASSVTDADRPFIYAQGHADGTVTLYYAGDTLPPGPTPEEIAAAQAAAEAERAAQQALRAECKQLRTDLNVIIDGITGATTLADLRGFVRDLAKALKTVTKLDSVGGQ